MKVRFRHAAMIIGMALATVTATASSAHAAPPTRVVDHTMDVICTGASNGVEITVRAEQSELSGSSSFTDISTATGEFLAYGSSTSDWSSDSVRTLIPVSDIDDQPAGEVYFSASFTPAGEPETIRSRFNDGNVHVVEQHSETALQVSDVVLTYGDTTFSEVRCDGAIVDGSLFFTNPDVHVSFSSGLAYDCDATNLDSWFISGPLDDLFVDVEYADVPGAQASGIVDVAEGATWSGEFPLQISDEPAGTVGVTATLGRSGQPIHVTDGKTGMRSQAQITPYPFTVTLQGPAGPATLDCTLSDIRFTWRAPNVG